MSELAQEINVSVGVKLHRLGVCEWEVKLWISSEGESNGAWRIVVSNVTGHTCIVHVRKIGLCIINDISLICCSM